MKKLIVPAALLIIVFSACKKEYACECTVKDPSGQTSKLTITTESRMTKAAAKSFCSSYKLGNNDDITCNLK